MIRLLPLGLLYAAVFHYAYKTYVNPVFEYAHYDYFAPSFSGLAYTYLLVAAPLIAHRRSDAPASYGAALIYAICYVPAQLMMLFTWQGQPGELALIQASLAGSMAVLFLASLVGTNHQRPPQAEGQLALPLHFLTLAALSVLVVVYRDHMRLVGFADVYDLRFETAGIEVDPVVDYMVVWLSYCFVPFYMARGILRKRPAAVGWALLASVLIYATTGSKAAILTPAIMYGLYLLIRSGNQFLVKLLASLTVGMLLIVQLIPDEGVLLWVKSILLVRILGTGGWTMATYYDYFSTNGFTYYTHIGPINALTDAYPYGEYSLGQLIGLKYSGSVEANFNANFWASDAFAALGIPGVPLVTAVLSAVFYFINRLASGYPSRFVALWLSGFWLALLNVPLSTAFISGGGALTLLLLWLARRPAKSPATPPVQSPEGEHSVRLQPVP
jgi:hypothetical protein